MLLHGDTDRRSVATAALEALRQGRADGLSDEEVVARTPVVLALLPPTIGPGGSLPDLVPSAPLVSPATAGDLGCREALRLRCRWVQEIGARAARELGTRLANAGVLDQPDLVRELTLDELRTALLDHRVPDDVAARASVAAGAPLPVAFRLAPSSVPVTATPRRHDQAGGLAASGGRSTGVVCHDTAELTSSVPCVLVVETLDPRLAPALPHLTGLVSETGSALSHLAILARELHVPAVVAVPDARARFPAGSQILLDGGTGEVRAVRPTKEA
jgi:pyruvate,water dikinase